VAAVLVLIDERLGETAARDWRDVAANFAAFTGEDALVMVGGGDALQAVDRFMEEMPQRWEVIPVSPPPTAGEPSRAAPMTSAPFVYRADGRPDWGAMWTGFCELALYGGPPHRGEAEALTAPTAVEPQAGESEAIAEIRRGIFETTGLYAEAAEPGWIAVTCRSKKMAAWLCATILLENVEARCDGEILYLPAAPGFELKNQIKSVITVLAKTNHYWEAHIASTGGPG
jgi:hypothetical protein